MIDISTRPKRMRLIRWAMVASAIVCATLTARAVATLSFGPLVGVPSNVLMLIAGYIALRYMRDESEAEIDMTSDRTLLEHTQKSRDEWKQRALNAESELMTKEQPAVRHPKHFELYIPTIEDWHPSFDGPSLRVSVYSSEYEAHARVLISVWGANDTGMEYWVACPLKSRESAVENAIALVKTFPRPLTRAWLEAQGFQRA